MTIQEPFTSLFKTVSRAKKRVSSLWDIITQLVKSSPYSMSGPHIATKLHLLRTRMRFNLHPRFGHGQSFELQG
jgi:hypothetical protein